MNSSWISCGRHRFPPQIIARAVWLYVCLSLSLREVEEMLSVRGIVAKRRVSSSSMADCLAALRHWIFRKRRNFDASSTCSQNSGFTGSAQTRQLNTVIREFRIKPSNRDASRSPNPRNTQPRTSRSGRLLHPRNHPSISRMQ